MAHTPPLPSASETKNPSGTKNINSQICNRIFIEPCPGKALKAVVVDKPPKSSDYLAGQPLIEYRPCAPKNYVYRFRGFIRASRWLPRFRKMLIAYHEQLLTFAKILHEPRCRFSRFLCTVCRKIDFIAKYGLAASKEEEKEGKTRMKIPQLAEEFEWLLTEIALDLRACYYHEPKDWKLKFKPRAWEDSLQGLLEICSMFFNPEMEKHVRVWAPVIEAHLTFSCAELRVTDDLTLTWYKQESEKAENKVLEDLHDGDYEGLVVYALNDEYVRSLKRQCKMGHMEPQKEG
jgi:hypothetical protein